ncbi:MAG: choice-of-anchor D domain-containing protein [Candidatus Kapaibacterium sp.]
MHSLFLSVFLLLVLVSGRPLFAQGGIPSDVRYFFIGWMPGLIHVPYFSNVTESYWVLVGSYADNNVVTISYFDDNGVETSGPTMILSKGRVWQQALDRNHMRPTKPGEVPEFKAARIRAKYPVSVQCYSEGSATGGMLQAIPTPALGKKYVAAAWVDNPIQSNPGFINRDSASSEFMVIAPYDHTTVTFTPASTTCAGIIGVNSGQGATGTPHPQTVVLRRGQIYWVRSHSIDPSYDMSGSLIVSDKPVAVIAGHERALLGDPSGIWTTLDNDTRDLMIEQMTPVEDWESEYPSAPFVSPPKITRLLVNGTGDMYRVYSADPSGSQVDAWIGGNISPYTLGLSMYQNPIPHYDNVIAPVDLVAHDGKKIYVVMYDYFQGQHDFDPGEKTKDKGHDSTTSSGNGGGQTLDETTYTCPNEMNVVPANRWRKDAVWKVPNNSHYRGYQFINVITYRDSIAKLFLSKNGAPGTPLSSWPYVGSFSIPLHPEYIAVRVKLPAADYSMTANTPFVVYSYGRTETEYKDGWGYAAPCGQAYGAHDENNKPRMDVTPDCSSWGVRIYDSRPGDDGIADIVLLDDAQGIYARPGRVSYNTRLNPTDPNFVAGDTSVLFRVEVINPLLDAYAAIYTVDKAGNDTVFELRYIAPKVTFTPTSTSALMTTVGADSVTRFVFHNNSIKGGAPIVITDANFKLTDPSFKITSTVPSIPATLKGGDSIVINVTYTASDTGVVHLDSLYLVTANCFNDTVAVIGSGATPIIEATDIDFGAVLVDSTKCKVLTVKNVGNANLIIDKNWVLHNVTEFTFGDYAVLPITLRPGASTKLSFCYTPHKVGNDSTNQDWGTNLHEPFMHKNKDFSVLIGRAVKPGVLWDRLKQPYAVVCQRSDTVRIWLYNNTSSQNGATEHVKTVLIEGADAAQFTMWRNQLNLTPLGNFDMAVGDSIWVDLIFTPDLAKGFAQRHATLTAYNATQSSPYVDISANVTHANLTGSVTSINFGVVQPGVAVPMPLKITNSGDADFTVVTMTMSDPVTFVATGLKVGDVIPAGASVNVTITGTLASSGSVSGTLSITGSDNCASLSLPLTMAADYVSVLGTGNTFPETFINCRHSDGSAYATNKGTRNVKLVQAIITGDATHPNADQFVFADGSTTMVVNRILKPGDTAVFNLKFLPTKTKNLSAVIEYTWDTASVPGFTWTSDDYLSGPGAALADTISALSGDTKPYSVKTGEVFDVPIHLTHRMPTNSEAVGYTFDVTYRQDLFHLVSVNVPAGYHLIGGSGNATDDGNGNETVYIKALGANTIDNLDEVAVLRFQLMVAKDLHSDFTVAHGAFFDKDTVDLCYVATEQIPGNFVPQDLCGDSTIRHKLRTGVIDGQITQVKPNPATTVASIEYEIRQQNTPVTIELYNVLGVKIQTVLSNEMHEIGAYRANIDASELQNGTYTVKFSTPGGSMNRMIVVRK